MHERGSLQLRCIGDGHFRMPISHANPYVDCDGICLTDTDGDGTCDELEIYGCSDENAVNYNPNVTEDNGSCVI